MYRFALLFSWVGLLFVSPLHANDPQPLKILLVCGGCCHDYQAQKNILQTGLEERAFVEVTVVHQGGSETNSKIELYDSPDWAAGYDLVIHDECFADVKDKSWVENILRPHRAGLPGVVLHCAMHCYRTGADDWFEFCGVTSHRHGAAYPHEVLNTNAEHPIMKNFGTAWANPAGEMYWIEKVWKTSTPLASAKNRENGNEEVCVWVNNYREKTRVFGTTLGHHNETVRSPEFLDLLTRGCLWSMNKLEADYLREPKSRLVPVNLALGKTATASSEEKGKGNLAPNAIDGKPDTRWCANGPEKNEWLQIDLGKSEKLTGARLLWENESATYSFTVEGSQDAKTWAMLFDGTKNEQAGVNALKFAAEIRYVRVTMLTNTRFNWASLWEVELHGTEMIEQSALDSRKSEEQKILAEVKVPAGFEATLFAAPPGVLYPVSVAAAPEGTVYVAVDKNGSLDRKPNHGAIYRLRDLDGDGRADETKLFVANVDSPRGLVWDRDRLYVMHPPHVSAFIDRDGDGHAEEQQVLVKNIAFTFKDRPADHTSNGVTLGIDGWLYLAIGDFGFMEAEGTDGRKLQLRGGGVVRVRPDGTNLEFYSHGTRNILEVSLDPYLNGFVRDNTNDGGGWDTRLHHFSGLENHGYPRLYMNFGEEIVQPLADYGGGSGCGGLYLDEPGFPAQYGNALYTCDWGRNWVYRHNMQPQGATFTANQHEAFGVPRVTDLDVDANSHLYIASWKGATFTYEGENVGYLVRVSPKDFKPEPLPNFTTAKEAELIALLASPSHRRRLAAQRELLHRGIRETTAKGLAQFAAEEKQPLAGRVAAIFAIKQGLGPEATPVLHELLTHESLREFVTRALFDREEENEKVSCEEIIQGLQSEDARLRLATVIALARRGERKPTATEAMTSLLADPDRLVAHTTVRALVALRGSEACFSVLDSTEATAEQRLGALQVVQALHEPQVVQALLQRLGSEKNETRRAGLLTALCRLYHREGEWKGDSWGTRPDTSGPYYQPVEWSESGSIRAAITEVLAKASSSEAAHLLREMARHKMLAKGNLEQLISFAAKNEALLPSVVDTVLRTKTTPDGAVPLLIKVAFDSQSDASLKAAAGKALGQSSLPAALAAVERLNQESAEAEMRAKPLPPSAGPLVETMPVEEAVAKVTESTGKLELGALLFVKLDCTKCHTTKADQPLKGPFLGTIANTYKRKELAEAILMPSKTLAQGFVTNLVVTDDGKQYTGFVVQEAAEKLTLRDGQGKEIEIPTESIEERQKLKVSIMPDGLANKLTLEQVASLVDYLQSLPAKQ